MGDSGREGGEEKYGFGITDAHLEVEIQSCLPVDLRLTALPRIEERLEIPYQLKMPSPQ